MRSCAVGEQAEVFVVAKTAFWGGNPLRRRAGSSLQNGYPLTSLKNSMRGTAALLRLVKLSEEMRFCAVRRWERTCVRDQAATSETHLSASFTSPRKAWGIRQASSPLLPVDFGGGVARGVKLGRLRWIAENYQRHRRYVFRHSEKPADSLHALLFGRNTAPARAKP